MKKKPKKIETKDTGDAESEKSVVLDDNDEEGHKTDEEKTQDGDGDEERNSAATNETGAGDDNAGSGERLQTRPLHKLTRFDRHHRELETVRYPGLANVTRSAKSAHGFS